MSIRRGLAKHQNWTIYQDLLLLLLLLLILLVKKCHEMFTARSLTIKNDYEKHCEKKSDEMSRLIELLECNHLLKCYQTTNTNAVKTAIDCKGGGHRNLVIVSVNDTPQMYCSSLMSDGISIATLASTQLSLRKSSSCSNKSVRLFQCAVVR